MNYSLFRNVTDPFILGHKRFNETLFKDQKLIDAAQQRKRVTAMTWDLNGQRLLTGSSDGYIRVRLIRQDQLLLFRYIIWSHLDSPRSLLKYVFTMMKSQIQYGTHKVRTISTHQQRIRLSRNGMQLLNLLTR